MSFTPEQAALIAEPGHVLALAGPGSGKTSTIIEKIARLLQQPGNRVVACSFSREGAEEIRRRLEKRMGKAAVEKADVRIGTFHSLIADHRKSFGRQGKMLSPAHQMRTLSTAAAESGDTLNNVLPQFEEIKYNLIPPDPNTLPVWFNTYESHLRSLKAFDLQDLIRLSVYQMALSIKLPTPPVDVDVDNCSMPVKLAVAAQQYRQELTGRCDRIKSQISKFESEGNVRAVTQLKHELQYIIQNEGALPLLGATHLVIDEAQDNDELQFALATLHALTGVPTTLIGDDDQCIYEWRRAMGYPGLMSFANTFGAKLITLGANFRSLRTIVEHAGALISHNNGHRIEKVFEARRGAGGDVQAEKADTDVLMAETATVMLLEASTPYDDPKGRFRVQVKTSEFGVLGRNNFVLDDMERHLLSNGIKYVRHGTSILQKEAAQYIYDILGAVYGGDLNGISVILQINGVSTSAANQVCTEITGKEKAFVDGRMADFGRFGASSQAVQNCSQWFEARRQDVSAGKHPQVIAEVCGVARTLYPIDGAYDKKALQNNRSIDAVQKCLTRMRGHVLTRVAALREKDQTKNQENAVLLMTFHGSKGLEFNNVLIMGADDKSCPGKGELMSERRLFYVAATRAKEFMLALYCGKPSRYLVEMGLA